MTLTPRGCRLVGFLLAVQRLLRLAQADSLAVLLGVEVTDRPVTIVARPERLWLGGGAGGGSTRAKAAGWLWGVKPAARSLAAVILSFIQPLPFWGQPGWSAR